MELTLDISFEHASAENPFTNIKTAGAAFPKYYFVNAGDHRVHCGSKRVQPRNGLAQPSTERSVDQVERVTPRSFAAAQ